MNKNKYYYNKYKKYKKKYKNIGGSSDSGNINQSPQAIRIFLRNASRSPPNASRSPPPELPYSPITPSSDVDFDLSRGNINQSPQAILIRPLNASRSPPPELPYSPISPSSDVDFDLSQSRQTVNSDPFEMRILDLDVSGNTDGDDDSVGEGESDSDSRNLGKIYNRFIAQHEGNLIKSLELSYKGLNGTIPDDLRDSLEKIDLSVNRLEGSIPDKLPESLRILDLSDNKLSGTIPDSLPEELEEIFLLANNLSGSIPDNLPENLKSLDLSGNNLTGTIPPTLHQCNSLSLLNLSDNELSGSIPDNLPKNLKSLDLYGNNLTGTIPPTLHQCTSLHLLNLSDNELSGGIPDELPEYLVKISLFSNKLSGGIPHKLPKNLKSLDLYENNLTGSIPDKLPVHLENLTLSNNKLSGSIPTKLSESLSSLYELDLSSNSLTGSIPNDLPKSLGLLNLSHNRLNTFIVSNKLPESLTNLDLSYNVLDSDHSSLTDLFKILPNNLLKLNLCNMELTGKIPVDFGDKFNSNTEMQPFLDMRYNNLSGPIPRSLGNIIGRMFDPYSGMYKQPVHNVLFDDDSSIMKYNNKDLYRYIDGDKSNKPNDLELVKNKSIIWSQSDMCIDIEAKLILLEDNEITIRDYLDKDPDNFIILFNETSGKKWVGYNMENIRTQHQTYIGNDVDHKEIKFYKEYYKCKGIDSPLNTLPNNNEYDRDLIYVTITSDDGTNRMIIKPDWFWNNKPTEPRVYELRKINKIMYFVTNSVIDYKENIVSADHCNQKDSEIQTYILIEIPDSTIQSNNVSGSSSPLRCKGLRKNIPPKCDDQDHCRWETHKGCLPKDE